MTTTSNPSFQSSFLPANETLFAPFPVAAVPVPRVVPATAAALPTASLWRQTQIEESEERSHRLVVRTIFAVLAALSIGSLGYAAWETGALFGGNHLQNAIGLLMR